MDVVNLALSSRAAEGQGHLMKKPRASNILSAHNGQLKRGREDSKIPRIESKVATRGSGGQASSTGGGSLKIPATFKSLDLLSLSLDLPSTKAIKYSNDSAVKSEPAVKLPSIHSRPFEIQNEKLKQDKAVDQAMEDGKSHPGNKSTKEQLHASCFVIGKEKNEEELSKFKSRNDTPSVMPSVAHEQKKERRGSLDGMTEDERSEALTGKTKRDQELVCNVAAEVNGAKIDLSFMIRSSIEEGEEEEGEELEMDLLKILI